MKERWDWIETVGGCGGEEYEEGKARFTEGEVEGEETSERGTLLGGERRETRGGVRGYLSRVWDVR